MRSANGESGRCCRFHAASEWWLKLSNGIVPFDYACFSVPALCDAKRSPMYLDGAVFDELYEAYARSSQAMKATVLRNLQIQYPYAYHFDAELLTAYLREYAQAHGVVRLEGNVREVKQAADGFVERGNVVTEHSYDAE